jgi:hypothetical protein
MMALQAYGKPKKVVQLSVPYKACSTKEASVMEGIGKIFRRGVLSDVTLVAGESQQKFAAHKLVLAAKSEVLYDMFCQDGSQQQTSAPCEIRLYETCPAAVKAFLDYVYSGEYEPRNAEANKDVLRLAQQFQMPELIERCAEILSRDVTTSNVVERLQICEEFELIRLRQKIMQTLTSNKIALHAVACSQQIVALPHLMQEMLGVIAQEGSPAKKPRKQ